ncbi:hypothetical protein BDN70DRAFT_880733 [Pholiota conissans]|uniref:Uncharacterized protein n=1 Tax=Pholiota conissans TaxID=109636 RepID=A0A9P5Z001_9AGAR|nr:hypothetical protein BDN70DRAFT_880733 [Pholiota conissans]
MWGEPGQQKRPPRNVTPYYFFPSTVYSIHLLISSLFFFFSQYRYYLPYHAMR